MFMNNCICRRCVMDDTDPDIVFYDDGTCSNCRRADMIMENLKVKRRAFDLQGYIEKIIRDGMKKKYDCIVGISGGVDSCYVMYLAKKMGLRPLAVHFDNGWNSELAVQNIRSLLEKLDIDLYTYVVNWQEFRDLQLAFLKASTPDSEIPTDHMIFALLALIADKYHVRYIIQGKNMSSESILPAHWSYGHDDWKYIKNVHKKYGTRPLKSFVYKSRMMNYYFRNRLEWFSILDYIDYDKEKAKEFLIQNFNWRDYGGKHYESFYTKFYQSYILPQKFGFDKRKAHYSSLIVSGQLSRTEALKMLEEPLYDVAQLDRDIEYFCEKMQINKDEFNRIMNEKPKSYWDYPNYENDWFGKLLHKIIVTN